MWIALPEDIANTFMGYDSTGWAACFQEEENGLYWIDLELAPTWFFNDEGPMKYDSEQEIIYTVDTRPSHAGEYIPTYIGE